MCSKKNFLRHSLRQPSTYSIFCPATTTGRDAVKTNFESTTFFCLTFLSSGDILERSFLGCVKPDGELFWNFLVSEFTVVTLIANTGNAHSAHYRVGLGLARSR